MKRRLILLAWYRHWRAFWFYQWNWAWTFYAGRGTTDQQRHCCIRCWRQLTWSRCEDPWRCICCSNALPKDIKHFPGLQQQRLLALHFWTTSVFDGWILFGPDSLKAGTRSNGAKVNVVSCYIWHHYLPRGRASWRTMRTRVTCFVFFFYKLKKLKFLAKYSSPLAVTTWSHHPQNINRPEPYEWMHAPMKSSTHEYFFILQKKIIIRTADTDVVVLAISVVE